MDDCKRINIVLERLRKEYPAANTALLHRSAFELLIATILSAQCTDERVNIVTRDLFEKYTLPRDYLRAEQEELEQDIFSTGFYRNKARNIRSCCQVLIDKFNGEVPRTIEELTSLPGVGRKTANVVIGHWFGEPAGIVVDTHVIRIAGLLGFTQGKNAEKIEQTLMEITSKEDWTVLTDLLIAHGRAVCIARRPRCGVCVLADICPSAQL
ncbi:endonuclease III [Ignavibacteria bacterium]|nr:endonuclease III [Bacteroidota bacterium]MCZ2133577.1 endonuclease III [Bacteroidota bacterium]